MRSCGPVPRATACEWKGGDVLGVATTGLETSGVLPPATLLALILAAGVAGGGVARFMRLPRVIGYLVAGIALRTVVAQAAGGEEALTAADPLAPLTALALGMILFTIGSVFDVAQFRSVGRRALRIAVVDAVSVFLFVSAVCAVVALVSGRLGGATAVWFGVLLGIAAVATAPAATLMVLREYEAKGPVRDTTLAIVGINNLLAIVLFYVAVVVLVAMGVADQPSMHSTALLDRLVMATLGSALLGFVLGLGLSIAHVNATAGQTFLLLIAALLGVGALGPVLHVNLLLVSLFAGAVFANVAIDPERLDRTVQAAGMPIFVAFFALAG